MIVQTNHIAIADLCQSLKLQFEFVAPVTENEPPSLIIIGDELLKTVELAKSTKFRMALNLLGAKL